MVLIIAVVINCSAANAYIEELTVPQKVSASAVIARIRVLKTFSIQPANPMQVAPFPVQYRNVARAEVLTLIKGQYQARQIEIEFNTGFTCPNVRYKVGEDCLVFLAKQKNGRYCTVNYYNGKHQLHGGVLPTWQGSEQVPVAQVIGQIRRLASKSTRG